MAKKILAVVLAVMMAVSAMAVTAFAAEIEVRPAAGYTTSYTNSLSASLTVPIATLYGFATEGDYIQFTLPTQLSEALQGHQVNYSIIVNGTEIKLMPSVPTLYKADAKGNLIDAAGTTMKYDSTDKKYYKVDANGAWVDAAGNVLTLGTDGKTYYYDSAAKTVAGAPASWVASARVELTPVVYSNGTESVGTVFAQPVYFGTFYHDYVGTIGNVTYYATIPQATAYNQYTNLTLVVTVDIAKSVHKTNNVIDAVAIGNDLNGQWDNGLLKAALDNFAAGKTYATAVRADYYKADNTWVQNSTSFAQNWIIQNGSSQNSAQNAFNFTTAEWTYDGIQTSNAAVLTWDHTLENRYAVQVAETAELVVTLDKPIVGAAIYSLYAKADTNQGYDSGSAGKTLWWNYNNSRVFVSSVPVDTATTGPVTELHFSIEDLSLLYDFDGYGTYNAEFVIFETPTLWNQNIMAAGDYLHVNRNSGMVKSDGGSYGPFSWNAASSGNNDLSYNGAVINYTPVTGGTVRATKVTLVTTEAEDTTTAVDTPTQGTENAEDSADEGADNFDATEETTTPADTNPTTGVALAVVPMLLAAAAAVVSKKH